MRRLTVPFLKISILLGLLVYFTWAHISLHISAPKQQQDVQSSTWRQPGSLDDAFPKLIAQHNWRIDYYPVEQILWQMGLNSTAQIIPNPALEERLLQVTSLLPQDINNEQWRRLNFLIQKSLPASASAAAYRLINQYFYYHHDHQNNMAEVQQAKGVQKLSLLRSATTQDRQRQIEYFGKEVADQLFAKKNLTTDYLLSRLSVSTNTKLSLEQKTQTLTELQAQYKNRLRDYQWHKKI